MKLRTAPKTMLTKLAIGAAAVSLLAVGGVATVSAFSDSATSTVTVAAGDINLQLGTLKAINLDLGQNIKPGATTTQTIVVNNKGSLPLNYTAATAGVTGTLPALINVTVRDMTVPATPVAIGSGMKMSTIAITPARSIAANSSQTLEIVYTWPNGGAGAENAQMNATGNAVLTFSATQQ
jgi:predicted ribosomally synthesized peptide with SipW-like signal peptide